MRKIMLLAVAVALVAAACKVETNAAVTINADGSGTFAIEIGFDDEAATILSQAGFPTSGDELVAGSGLDQVPGAEVSSERRGDLNIVVIQIPLEDITMAGAALGQASNNPLTALDIEFSEDTVRVDAGASLDDAFAEMGGTEGLTGALPPEQVQQFLEAYSATIRITFPGTILEHNADQVDGLTLAWDVPFDAPVEIQATASLDGAGGGTAATSAPEDTTTAAPEEGTTTTAARTTTTEADDGSDMAVDAESDDDGGFPIWLIVFIVVVVIGAIAFFVVRGRSGSAAPAGDTSPPIE